MVFDAFTRHEKAMDVEQGTVDASGGSTSGTITPPEPVEELDADKIKEKGNTAFKGGRFQEAIEQYSRAIGVSSISLFRLC